MEDFYNGQKVKLTFQSIGEVEKQFALCGISQDPNGKMRKIIDDNLTSYVICEVICPWGEKGVSLTHPQWGHSWVWPKTLVTSRYKVDSIEELFNLV